MMSATLTGALATIAALVCLAVVDVFSGEPEAAQGGHAAGGAMETEADRWHFEPFPARDLYPTYIADPRRASFGIQAMSIIDTEIPDTGDDHYGLRLGGRFGLVRVHPAGNPNRGMQINIEAAFIGQFDRDNSQDNIGWDGIYALILSTRTSESLAFKLGAHHTSSHIGDEFQERTGRQRINYTREEFLAGVSRSIGDRWMLYGEAAYGYELRTVPPQKPWRGEIGIEHQSRPDLWKNRMGWYAALDASAYEERDWDVNFAAQLGLVWRTGERAWRIGLDHYDGRSQLGEFFQEDECFTALGFWLSL